MIHTATSLLKFRQFSRFIVAELGVSRNVADVIAVGTLELLWHLGIRSVKRGNIGQLSNLEIADEVKWEGDPDKLIEKLVEFRWLDRCSEHRLVIHDWHEHAPGFIKRNIGRVGGFVSCHAVVSECFEQGSSQLVTQTSSSEHCSDRLPTQMSTQAATHNITQHNQTKQNKTVGEGADKPLDPAGASEDEPKPARQRRKPKSETEGFGEWTIPASLDSPKVRKLLDDFAAMRRKMKKPIADFSHASTFLSNFTDVEHLTYALQFCLANRYQGLKPEYRPQKGTGGTAHSQSPPKREIITTIER